MFLLCPPPLISTALIRTLPEGGEGSSTGSYSGGDGGDVHLIGGPSGGKRAINDRAGHVILEGGKSSAAGVGGSIKVQSGSGSESGVILMETGDESFGRSTGPMAFKTGNTDDGMSGDVILSTGSATLEKGKAGSIKLEAGTIGSVFSSGNYYNNPYHTQRQRGNEGGEVSVIAGASHSGIGGTVSLSGGSGSAGGGNVNLTAGEGMYESVGGDTLIYGGYSVSTGGLAVLQGGTGAGKGGDVQLRGGTTTGNNKGGDAVVESGDSLRSGSGSVIVRSGDTESSRSGNVDLTSGTSSTATGNVKVGSGQSRRGQSGHIDVVSGGGDVSGRISLASGRSHSGNSGDIEFSSGEVAEFSSEGDSGKLLLSTAKTSSTRGSSGEISIMTGKSVRGNSGGISLEAGMSKGDGGDVALKASNSESIGGSIILESGSSEYSQAGDITLKTGSAPRPTTSSDGGNINMIARTISQSPFGWSSGRASTKAINFGFDHVTSSGSETRLVALQVKKSRGSMRIVSSVPGKSFTLVLLLLQLDSVRITDTNILFCFLRLSASNNCTIFVRRKD